MMKLGNQTNQFVTGVLIACLLPFLTGCDSLRDDTLTGKLWDSGTLASHREPASDPKVRLFEQPGGTDILVQYNEEKESNGKVRRRAYYLLANESRVESRKKPHFARDLPTLKLEPVSLLSPAETVGVAPLSPVWAELSPDGQSFKVFRDGKEFGYYRLPVYPDRWHQAGKVALTPVTVVADVGAGVLIVGVAAGVLYLAARADGCEEEPHRR